jgi:hypothetical protein
VTWQGQVVGPLLASAGVDGLGAGEDVESEVAAAFGPFVVLFGEDRANEPDDRAAVGEEADDVAKSSSSTGRRFSEGGVFVPAFTSPSSRTKYNAPAIPLAAPVVSDRSI